MLDLAIDEAKVAWTLAFAKAPREVLTAYGQSIMLESLEARRVRGEGGSLEEQVPGPSGLFNLVAPRKVKCARGPEEWCRSREVGSTLLTLEYLARLPQLPRTVRYRMANDSRT